MKMESRRFSDVLRAAVAGDPFAVEAILDRYMPLINSRSVIDGALDEDMRQYILMRVIMLIPKFDPDWVK
jgi:hypothetical protein